MFVAVVFIALALIYTLTNLALVLLRNYKAHQFYKTKAPKLPTLPRTNLFDGHAFAVITQEKNWKIIEGLHAQYGPTFGLYYADKPWVSTKDIDLLKLIEVDQAHKHTDRASLGLPFSDFNHSIFQVNGDRWRRVRRAIAPALTNIKVRTHEVTSDIESVLAQLQAGIEHRMRKTSAKSKLPHEANNNSNNDNNDNNNNNNGEDEEESMIFHADDMLARYTLAVIFLITYKREGTIDFMSERDKWVTKVEESARQMTNPLILLSMCLPFMRSLIEFVIQFHPVGKMKAQIIDYIVQATDLNRLAREQHSKAQRRLSLETGVAERPFSELKRTDTFKRRLVDTIIDALMDKKMEHDEFLGSTLFLLLAGYMTTADTVTCLVWQLARHPDIQEKLRASIEREGLDAEYLHWCVQETVRYHPAVPLGVGRVLGEDVEVNGTFLPKGCFVMASNHSIHHDPAIWPEPERFWPERWQRASEFHPAAFMGFGLGPRNCVGGKLAMHEIKLATRLLLANYRIEKCAETPDQYEFSSPGLLWTNLDVAVKVRLVKLRRPAEALV